MTPAAAGPTAAAAPTAPAPAPAPARAAWSAVYAMALGVFVLIASEFLPVSLLSPIAADLHLSEGQAGQAIAVSGLFAVVTSLTIAAIAGRIDRRHVLVALTALMAVSGVVVAVAPGYAVLMGGRALLGITIGGFWGLSTAVVMRLVPAAAIPRALGITNGGNAIATTIAAPLGSFAAGLVGWRGAFFAVVPLAVAAAIWLAAALPALTVARDAPRRTMAALLRDRAVAAGLAAILLLFMGQFALFTYLRPFLERVTGVGVTGLSLLLLTLGVAGFVGTLVVGRFVRANLHRTLWAIPAVMALTAAALALFGGSPWASAALLVVWGLTGTAAPVAWGTWLTRVAPDDSEAGGGLMIAVIQLAITLGAATGGWLFDHIGPRPEFGASAAILGIAAGAAWFGTRD